MTRDNYNELHYRMKYDLSVMLVRLVHLLPLQMYPFRSFTRSSPFMGAKESAYSENRGECHTKWRLFWALAIIPSDTGKIQTSNLLGYGLQIYADG